MFTSMTFVYTGTVPQYFEDIAYLTPTIKFLDRTLKARLRKEMGTYLLVELLNVINIEF